MLLLVSVDAATRADAHLQHPSPLFQLTSGSDESSFNLRARLRDQYAPFVDKPTPPVPVLSAGGLARRLITQLRTTNALVIYVAEGDSRPDAKLLAHATLKVMPEGCQGMGIVVSYSCVKYQSINASCLCLPPNTQLTGHKDWLQAMSGILRSLQAGMSQTRSIARHGLNFLVEGFYTNIQEATHDQN